MMVASLDPQKHDEARTALLMKLLPAYQGSIWQSQLMSPADVSQFVGLRYPVINTDHNRRIEYATPRYNSSEYDWKTHNVQFFKNFGTGR